MAYNLYSGLKQILEDKRIRRFGVPKEIYNDYLMSEQFVIDMRTMNKNEMDDVLKTYSELKEFGLEKPPYDNFTLHFLQNLNGKPIVNSFYWFKINNEYKFILLCDSQYMAEKTLELINSLSYDEMENERSAIIYGKWRMVVLLATRNAIKEHHKIKASQELSNGTPHKKGSGGYTIIRPPEGHELEGGTHTSPRPHFRRGHIRKLHPEDKTRWIFVSSCFVNGEPEVSRKAYLVA